jgi:hypothetical protein
MWEEVMQANPEPTLNPQVIGQAESALGALLTPVLQETGRTFEQWLVLTVLTAGGVSSRRSSHRWPRSRHRHRSR